MGTTMTSVIESLEDSEEWRWLRDQHLAFYLALAERAAREIEGSEPVRWLALLDEEHDNLRLALEWALLQDGDAAARLAIALNGFWAYRGIREGAAYTDRALEHIGDRHPAARARLLYEKGWSWAWPDSQACWREAAALARAAGTDADLALILSALSEPRSSEASVEERVGLAEEAVEVARRSGDRRVVAEATRALAHASRAVDPARSHALYEEAVRITEQEGWRRSGAQTRLAMCGSDGVPDRIARAELRAHLEQVVDTGRELGIRHMTFWALDGLGWESTADGEVSRAVELRRELLEYARSLGPRAASFLPYAMTATAELRLMVGDAAGAVSMLDEAGDHWDAAWTMIVRALAESLRGDADAARAAVRHSLDVAVNDRDRQWRLQRASLVHQWHGDADAARAAVEEAIRLWEVDRFLPVGNLGPLHDLAVLELATGRRDEARALFERVLAEVAPARSGAPVLLYLADIARMDGDGLLARQLVADAWARSEHAPATTRASLLVLARLAVTDGSPDDARTLVAAAGGVAEAAGLVEQPYLGALAGSCWVARAEGTDHLAPFRGVAPDGDPAAVLTAALT